MSMSIDEIQNVWRENRATERNNHDKQDDVHIDSIIVEAVEWHFLETIVAQHSEMPTFANDHCFKGIQFAEGQVTYSI